MAKVSSSGGASKRVPTMGSNKSLTNNTSSYQKNTSKTNNFMSGKSFSKPFKNK